MVCILVVEDETEIREILVDVLGDAGFEIVEAGSADAAIQMLEVERPRLVVTDINLPGSRDGIDVALAARIGRPSIPVIFMSGQPVMLEKARARCASASFLQKPFSLKSLLDEISRLDTSFRPRKSASVATSGTVASAVVRSIS